MTFLALSLLPVVAFMLFAVVVLTVEHRNHMKRTATIRNRARHQLPSVRRLSGFDRYSL